jgi:hypothetical protein
LPQIDFAQLVSEHEVVGEDEEETLQLKALINEARRFVGGFSWCQSVRQAFLGFGIDGLIATVLVRIRPRSHDVDEWLWVIVGDVPPLYLVTDRSPTPAAALKTYIELCQEWVDAVKEGGPVEGLAPIDAPPDAEHADMLERRVRFLETEILPELSSRPRTP